MKYKIPDIDWKGVVGSKGEYRFPFLTPQRVMILWLSFWAVLPVVFIAVVILHLL